MTWLLVSFRLLLLRLRTSFCVVQMCSLLNYFLATTVSLQLSCTGHLTHTASPDDWAQRCWPAVLSFPGSTVLVLCCTELWLAASRGYTARNNAARIILQMPKWCNGKPLFKKLCCCLSNVVSGRTLPCSLSRSSAPQRCRICNSMFTHFSMCTTFGYQ